MYKQLCVRQQLTFGGEDDTLPWLVLTRGVVFFTFNAPFPVRRNKYLKTSAIQLSEVQKDVEDFFLSPNVSREVT